MNNYTLQYMLYFWLYSCVSYHTIWLQYLKNILYALLQYLKSAQQYLFQNRVSGLLPVRTMGILLLNADVALIAFRFAVASTRAVISSGADQV